jgi:hypothetical protein
MAARIQELFDELAEGLATNGLSRRQVLKGVAGGLLLAGPLSFLVNGRASAQTPNVRRDPVRVSSCQKFSNYIKNTGVTDEFGKNHKTLAGITTYGCRSTYDFEWERTKSTTRGSVCVKTTKLTVAFDALGKVTVVDWQPTQPQTTRCQTEEQRFEDSAVAHEMRHVKDINEVVATANTAWESRPPLKACADNQKNAVKALEQKITNAVKAECSRIEQEIKKQGEEFDNSPKGKLPLHCDRCQAAPTKIYCNCNKTCYDDVQVCLSECKATLGCFTGICEPAQPGQCPP